MEDKYTKQLDKIEAIYEHSPRQNGPDGHIHTLISAVIELVHRIEVLEIEIEDLRPSIKASSSIGDEHDS
jgi:hypothetical protein